LLEKMGVGRRALKACKEIIKQQIKLKSHFRKLDEQGSDTAGTNPCLRAAKPATVLKSVPSTPYLPLSVYIGLAARQGIS
jgi:hypothetical protein